MSSPQQKPLSVSVGVMLVVFTLVGWSSVPLFLRHFAESIDAWTSNGWRYGFSALIWLPVLLVAWSRGRVRPGLWRAAIVPSIVNAMGQACFTWAHYRISPGLLTFGLRTQLLFVAIGAWMMFPKERAIIRTKTFLLGALILMLGTVGVIFGTPGGEAATDVATTGASWGTMQAHIEGVVLALLSGLLFAGYGLAVRKYMEGINSVHAFAMICQYTAGVMVVLMLSLGADFGMTVLTMPAMEIVWLLLSAVIGIAIGHVFYYMAITRLGVSVTTGVLQLQPFIVAVMSMILFHELLAWSQWISGIIAVSGAGIMLSVQWRISKAKRISVAPLEIAEGESGS